MLLVRRDRSGDVVACACEEAEALGVRAGLSLAHAQALIRDTCVHVEPYAPEEYAAKLRRLARWAERFSPVAVADDPDGLLLDIAGCERVFGGEEQIVRRVAASLHALGFPARVAVAPTAACAWAVARFGPEPIARVSDAALRAAVAPLPVAALRISQETIDSLSAVGIEIIAHLLDIPRLELAGRFGGEVLRRLDQLTGVASEGIEAAAPEKRFEAVHAFDGPIARADIVEFVVRSLLSSLLADLDSHGLGVRILELAARRVDAQPAGFRLSLTRATRDPAHLWSLLLPRLERLRLGCGVESLCLRAREAGRVPQEQMTLWADAQLAGSESSAAAFGEFLDRLIERFGPAAVRRFMPVETYVPERAFAVASCLSQTRTGPGNHCQAELDSATRARRWIAKGHKDVAEKKTKAEILCVNRPSRLFHVPEPAGVVALVPDGPPAQVQWRGRVFSVRSGSGPERIAFPWWTHGENSMVRDYYEVQLEDGRWLWLFRLTTDAESRPWFVHGEWT